MPWIESHTVLIRHRKVIEMASKLQVKPVQILGHIHALWHTVLEQQEDGDLSKWSDEFIAQAAHWSGDSLQFVNVLRQCNFLDGSLLHDWIDYAGRYLTSKYRITNPMKLKKILAKHKRCKSPIGRQSKDGLKTDLDGLKTDNLPNLPNLPNQDNQKENKEKEKSLSSRTSTSDEVFFDALKNNLAYRGVDIENELAKMDMWLLLPKNKCRKKTHRFILNWLNKAERTLPEEVHSNELPPDDSSEWHLDQYGIKVYRGKQ